MIAHPLIYRQKTVSNGVYSCSIIWFSKDVQLCVIHITMDTTGTMTDKGFLKTPNSVLSSFFSLHLSLKGTWDTYLMLTDGHHCGLGSVYNKKKKRRLTY